MVVVDFGDFDLEIGCSIKTTTRCFATLSQHNSIDSFKSGSSANILLAFPHFYIIFAIHLNPLRTPHHDWPQFLGNSNDTLEYDPTPADHLLQNVFDRTYIL